MISSKKLEKIEKALGREFLSDLSALSEVALKNRIAESAGSIKHAQEELEANLKYQELKEGVKAISEGLKEVRKRQNNVITYCLNLLEERGAE